MDIFFFLSVCRKKIEIKDVCRAILSIALEKKPSLPLPSFWYLPEVFAIL
jgi:hypothetical protein